MTTLIDFSLFQYKCIEINQGDEAFTYKTDENTSENIINELFLSKKNNHEVKELKQINLILKIFKSFGFKEQFIDQYIGNNPIYQIKTNGERRLFFIIKTIELSKKDKIIIIKPLFLDVNHVIYNNEHFQKNFQICSVCVKKECSRQINQID